VVVNPLPLIAGLVLALTGAASALELRYELPQRTIFWPMPQDDEVIPLPRERPDLSGGVTQLFDEDGNRIGMTVDDGDTTTFYDTKGKKAGSMKMIGGKPIYFNAWGKRTRGVRL
jgi:hypothetical protein